MHEYKRIRLHLWEERMNQYAAEGWELVLIYCDQVYLKRLIQTQ